MSVVDTISLVLHVLAATAIVGGGIVQVMAGTRLRAATTGRDAAQWASFARAGGMVVLVPRWSRCYRRPPRRRRVGR